MVKDEFVAPGNRLITKEVFMDTDLGEGLVAPENYKREAPQSIYVEVLGFGSGPGPYPFKVGETLLVPETCYAKVRIKREEIRIYDVEEVLALVSKEN